MQKRRCTVLIPYFTKDREVFVFLQKRSKDNKVLPDYFGFWGGGIEEDETIEEGLKREAREELGVEVSEHQHFARYEFYGSIKDVFSMEVGSNFADSIVVGEGDYGKFFSEEDTIKESRILDEDRVILRNFFGKLKRDNPYYLYLK